MWFFKPKRDYNHYDQPLKKVLDQWKYLIGYVPQETFILNDTIKNNVGIFDIKAIKSKKKK